MREKNKKEAGLPESTSSLVMNFNSKRKQKEKKLPKSEVIETERTKVSLISYKKTMWKLTYTLNRNFLTSI